MPIPESRCSKVEAISSLMIPEHGTIIGGYLLQNFNDGGVPDWSPFTNALPSTRNAQTPNDWDVRLVNIKLSARWQEARVKSIIGTCTKIESSYLIDDSALNDMKARVLLRYGGRECGRKRTRR